MPKLASCSSAVYLQISVCLAAKFDGLRAASSGCSGGNQDRCFNPEVQNCSPVLFLSPSACLEKPVGDSFVEAFKTMIKSFLKKKPHRDYF